MLQHWEDPFESDDEQDDEAEAWREEASPPPVSDSVIVERFLGEIDLALCDRNGNSVSCPREPRAGDLLPSRLGIRLWKAHSHLLARWPRLCTSCNAEFRGPQRQMTRCPTCRRTGRVVERGRP